MPVSFRDILNKYRAESISEKEKGTKFEELMTRYFMTVPIYSFKWVKIWNDFPYKDELGSVDTGIDIVAKTEDDEYYAIQCKFYSEDYTVSKKDVDTFISTSGREFHDDDGIKNQFSLRLIVATTNNWSANAIEVTKGQTIPVELITLDILEKSQVDWDKIENGIHGENARNEKYELRQHQKIAYDKALLHYETEDRGRMIMACGTGKTFTSLRIAEGLINNLREENKTPLVLFLAPSISLVRQTLWSWTSNADEKINAICVCSDISVGKNGKNDDNYETTTEIGYPVILNPESIVKKYLKNDNFTVIFSTYQSIDSIIEAQQKGLPKIDFIVCDEAHRTTGVIISNKDESSFVKCHKKVDAKKRLYMTATPRIYGIKGKETAKKESIVLCSMDDETIYGKEFYRLTFGEAIEKELLSDYKVLILTTTYDTIPDVIKYHKNKKSKEINADTDCKIWGCLNALAKNVFGNDTVSKTDPGPMKSAVAFSRSIKVSTALTERINELSKCGPIKAIVKHIDGSMDAIKRQGLLDWLKEDNGECHILSNVRCLSEGVDVPALDAVMFMDAKGSFVDVVQSVGRVMRKANGKKYGYIVIPVVIPKDEDPSEALDSNENYKVVWQVLRALRSHDERLEAEINTFQYNKDNKRSRICIGMPDCTDNTYKKIMIGQWTLDDFEGQLYAKLVEKVGDRVYIENWAKKVAEITPKLNDTLKKICESQEYGTKQYKPAFKRYLKGLRACVNEDVPESQAIDMLTQQVITKPIFEELFSKDGFVMRNSVYGYIDMMLNEIDAKNGLKKIQNELDNFHNTVKLTLEKIDTTDGKQAVIAALYEKFFKNAFPKDQSINGVVYTPQEIVDFIIRSVVETIKQEFNIDINDENVNVLDPFSGTGTFIARLMEIGVIRKENIERKYKHELFANEITLLAYYIATVNIENTFQRIMGRGGGNEYIPFDNALLTDTFNIEEISQHTIDEKEYFVKNKARIKRENNTPIAIIMGNPPYGGRQKSFNDDAKKRSYDNGIDKRISETYLDNSLFSSKKVSVNSVYDNYIRAIRWSTDRMKNDGIISFVIPNGWITSSTFEGFRKCIEKEFSSIYIFNLRGNQNANWREEGEKVFGQGSKVGIAITLFVKRKNFSGKAKIYYYEVPDNKKRIEKLSLLNNFKSFKHTKLESIKPKQNGDWIIERNELFNKLIPIACDTRKKFEKHSEDTIFVGYSLGFSTNRDVWSYNFSHSSVSKNMKNMIDEYNSQLLSDKLDRNNKIKWDETLENCFKSKKIIQFDEKKIEISMYRPFTKKWFYNDPKTTSRIHQMPRIFTNRENVVICCPGIGVTKEFSCLVTDINIDLNSVGATQCFPLYWYENDSRNKDQTRLLDKEIVRHYGVSDYALKIAQNKYGNVKKEDIFYYIYGYLHSKDYRSAFCNDLKYSLPRINFVNNKNDFYMFSEAGRKLADLHINYEKVEPYKDVKISIPLDDIDESFKINKMKLDRENRKIICNQYVTIENIPEKAFRYIVNGRSALEWVVNQYQYYKDKEFDIIDNPNDYDGCKYIIKLILSLITVSIKTMEIVENLPKLDFNEKTEEGFLNSLLNKFTKRFKLR